METCIGAIVCSRAGRDKGGLFVVVGMEEDILLLADGDTRKVEKPKRKKRKHINRTNFVASLSVNPANCEIRKVLSEYKSSN